jgi:long-chain acyl-CoA synthetase
MAHWPEGLPKTVAYPDIPVHGILSHAVGTYGPKTAVVHEGKSLTYDELEENSNRLANLFSEMGTKKGDRILIYLRNSPEFVIAYYGILKAGGIVITASPLCKEWELANQAKDFGAEIIVFMDELYPTVSKALPDTNLKGLISVGDESKPGATPLSEILEKHPPNPLDVAIDPREDVAVIQSTGGTTGVPKGAMLTHTNLVSNAIMNALWFKWTDQERVMGMTPFYHTWGPNVCMNSVFHVGAAVHIVSQFDAEACLEMIERERISVFYAVTSLWQMLIHHPTIEKYDLSSLRYVKAGGMPILQEVKEAWERLTGVPLIPGYGLTEASPECTNNPPHRVKGETIGIPIIDTDARVVHVESGRDQPPMEEGELLIKGPQVMKGYWRDAEGTAKVLEEGWLHTGDIAFMDHEGYFHFVERARDMIKYKGHGVFPAELEDVLTQHPAVRECAVVGRPQAISGEIPLAFVVLKKERSVTEEELIEFCREKIAPYKRIREVRFINEIPKTPVGKILKRRLRDML